MRLLLSETDVRAMFQAMDDPAASTRKLVECKRQLGNSLPHGEPIDVTCVEVTGTKLLSDHS